jgi:predicted Zn-dependent protease
MRPWCAALWLFLSLVAAGVAQASTLSPATYENLNDIQTLLAEENWAEAREELDELLEDLQPGFGKALALQLSGQYWLAQENNAKAIAEFEQALAQNAFAPAQESGMATNVAQLYLAEQQAKKAQQALEQRLPILIQAEQAEQQKTGKSAQFVQPMAMITLATAYQLQENYASSINWVEQAIQRRQQLGKSPQENWWRMLMVAQYRENQWQNALRSLDVLIALAPDKESYWQQQAGIYQQQNQAAKALTVLETAYAGGYLEQNQSLLLLVQLQISQGLPERAGRILAQGIQSGAIEQTERNWRLLATAWQQGRERAQAIQALQQASQTPGINAKDSGELLYRAAQLAMQDGDHQAVIDNAKIALEKKLSDKSRAQLLLLAGGSAFQAGMGNEASAFFRQALKLPQSAGTARQWLDYIASMDEYGMAPGSFAGAK